MGIKFPTLKVSKSILAVILLLLVLASITFLKPKDSPSKFNSSVSDNSIKYFSSTTVNFTSINNIYRSLEAKIAKVEHDQTRAKRIEVLVDYLTKVHSPINTEHYASLIIDLAEANGVDYRIIVALIGTESGWCKAPIHYNCFGYLNKVKYASFDDAFNRLIPKISKQYFIRYGWDLVGFISVYGALTPEYAQSYARNMLAIANKLYW